MLKCSKIASHFDDFFLRTEKNPDGSFIDNFIRTIIGGRKIHGGGKGAAKVKPARVRI